MTVMEAVDMLDGLVDESDPDVDFPNSFHAFQTAEGIRKAHPDKGAPPTRPAAGGGGGRGGTLPQQAPPPAQLSSPPQTGSTSWGSCTTWGRSWLWRGSPR